MCAAIDGAVKSPSEETPAEKTRKEYDEGEERGQHEEVMCERECPETEERQQRKEDNDVNADEPIDRSVREQLPPIEQIADDERQNQIGEEIDKTSTNFIHNFPNLPKQIRWVHLSTSYGRCKYFRPLHTIEKREKSS